MRLFRNNKKNTNSRVKKLKILLIWCNLFSVYFVRAKVLFVLKKEMFNVKFKSGNNRHERKKTKKYRANKLHCIIVFKLTKNNK